MSKKAEAEYERVLSVLNSLDPGSKEYEAVVNNFRILCEARSKKPWRFIDLEIILPIAGNILGILIIVHYEHANVLVSRAFALIGRK